MVIFRADGNSEIGMGHIMRCLTIADTTKSASLFILADGRSTDCIIAHGHKAEVLNTDYRKMETESEKIDSILSTYPNSVLIVDSYFITREYLEILKAICKKYFCLLVYMDDILSYAYPCDILINYNIYGPGCRKKYAELYRKEEMSCPLLLLGPQYAPLRVEFQNIPIRQIRHEGQRIMVSTGGSDPDHITRSVVEYIYRNPDLLSQFEFFFVVGAMAEDKDEIIQMVSGETNIHVMYNVTDMRKLMDRCDVAISAAGSTLYELCATQTPTITYILADNQILGAEEFEKEGILKCVGDLRHIGRETLSEQLITEAVKLANNYNERCRIAIRQRAVVDGMGTNRIIDSIDRFFAKNR